jgi:hypothetical protein
VTLAIDKSARFWDRLGREKARQLRALLSGEDRSGVVLDANRGECVTKLGAADPATKKRRFEMLAYTGKRIFRLWGDMVIDAAGIERPDASPMLLEHVDAWPVGVADAHEVDGGNFKLKGYMLSNAEATKLVADMDEGCPYKASVGIRFVETTELEADAEAEVNGETLRGPLTIVRRCRLFETSFLLNPADLDTEVSLLNAQPRERTPQMTQPQVDEKVLEEIRAQAVHDLMEKSRLMAEAFPARPKFVQRMLLEGRSVQEAKALAYDGSRKKAERLAEELHEAKKAQKTARRLREDARMPASGIGFNAAERETGKADKLANLSPGARAKSELRKDPLMARLFESFRGRGGEALDPAKTYARALALETKFRPDMRPLINPDQLERAAAVLRELCDGRFGVVNRDRLLAGDAQRLGAFKAGPDYAVITAKGFLGMFYPRFEDELAGVWANMVAFRSESSQETEIHRWLGLFPQMALWSNDRQATPMPTYSTTVTNLLYQAAIEVDKNDFRFQKFGLISQRLGEGGAVAAEHWNALATTLLEGNGNCYDGSAFYSSTHALGGQAPATQQNDFTKNDAGAFNPADPNRPTVAEAVEVIQTLITYMRTFKYSNNQPANGGAKSFVIEVPPLMEANFAAAVAVDRLNFGQQNPLLIQNYSVQVIPNARETVNNVVRCHRIDCMNRTMILQEPGPPEVLFQGPGSYLEWFKHAYGYAIESTRALGLGDWLSGTRATLG